MDDSKHRPARVRKAKTHRNNYAWPGPFANTVGLIVPKTQTAPSGAPSNPPVYPETQEEKEFAWLSAYLQEDIALPNGGITKRGMVTSEIERIAKAARAVGRDDLADNLIATTIVPFSKPAVTDSQSSNKTKAKSRHGQYVDKRIQGAGGIIMGRRLGQGNPRCELVQYGKQACREGRTPHHVVPDHVFKQPGENGQRYDENFKYEDGWCICVEGVTKSTGQDGKSKKLKNFDAPQDYVKSLAEHGRIHWLCDMAEAMLGKKGDPEGTTTLGQMEAVGAWAVAFVTGCDAADIKKQLREKHQEAKLDKNFKVRADPAGRIKNLKPEEMGKPKQANTSIDID